MEMMGYNKDLPIGAEETRQVNFALPTALDENVLGTDSKTNLQYFNLATINAIIRAWEDLAQTDTRLYEYDILRDGYLIRTLYSQQLKVEIQGPIFPGFPLNLSPGQYQIQMRQVATGGGLQARSLNVVWQKSLV